MRIEFRRIALAGGKRDRRNKKPRNAPPRGTEMRVGIIIRWLIASSKVRQQTP
jgi:hypothetical protein